jgi:hypothetical protein
MSALHCQACGQQIIDDARMWILRDPMRAFCSERCLRVYHFRSEADHARNDGVGLAESVHQSTVEMGE